MYSAYLIFALLYGLLLIQIDSSSSKPGYLDFDNLPETNFSCDGKVIGGYYADVETGCQMFHVCTIGQKGEVTDIKFLCLNGTVFDQETRVCERIDEVDCSKSEDFFGLNLELYGNNANFGGGIQAEEEFGPEEESAEEECGEGERQQSCATASGGEGEDYSTGEEGAAGATEQQGQQQQVTAGSSTTPSSSTSSSSTTPGTTPSTTTSRPPPQPQPQLTPSSSTTSRRPLPPQPSPVAAHLPTLLAQLHHPALTKPPPPRIINNAFSPTSRPPSSTPNSSSQRPIFPSRRPIEFSPSYRPRYPATTPDSASYGSYNLQQRERPYYFTPATVSKSNYHHFQSGDTSFGHSFDANRPYNFQYFHSHRKPEENKALSVVTSTRSSTSAKTENQKQNATEEYDDYQDDLDDQAYFEDVPKLRQRRDLISLPINHKFDGTETTTPRHPNHKYDDEQPSHNDREEFLENLLGSIDLDEDIRQKMKEYLIKEDKEMDKLENNLTNTDYDIGQIFTLEMNDSNKNSNQTKLEALTDWIEHFNDMSKDISLNYTLDSNVTDVAEKSVREKRDTYRTAHLRTSTSQTKGDDRPPPRRTSIDTEKFMLDLRRKKAPIETKPVVETIIDDFTTVEYRKSSKYGRSQPKATTSLRSFTFNYEATTSIPLTDRVLPKSSNFNPQSSKDSLDLVNENVEEEKSLGAQIKNQREVFKSNVEPIRLRPSSAGGLLNSPIESSQGGEVSRGRNVGGERRRVSVTRRTKPTTTEASVQQQPVTRRGRGRQRLSSGATNTAPRPRTRSGGEAQSSDARTGVPVRSRPKVTNEQELPRPNPNLKSLENVEEEVGQDVVPVAPETSRLKEENLKEEVLPSSVDSRLEENNNEQASTKGGVDVALERLNKEEQREEVSVGFRSRESNEELPTVNLAPVRTTSEISTGGRTRSRERSSNVSQPQNGRVASRTRGRTSGAKKAPLSREHLSSDVEDYSQTETTDRPRPPALVPDPDFDCEGKVKGGFYADLYNDCKAFFICSQGAIGGPLLKTHFPCGDKTKFNQRSRTCQAEDLVECKISTRYYHLNNDFLVPVSEDELRGGFEPMKQG